MAATYYSQFIERLPGGQNGVVEVRKELIFQKRDSSLSWNNNMAAVTSVVKGVDTESDLLICPFWTRVQNSTLWLSTPYIDTTYY